MEPAPSEAALAPVAEPVPAEPASPEPAPAEESGFVTFGAPAPSGRAAPEPPGGAAPAVEEPAAGDVPGLEEPAAGAPLGVEEPAAGDVPGLEEPAAGAPLGVEEPAAGAPPAVQQPPPPATASTFETYAPPPVGPPPAVTPAPAPPAITPEPARAATPPAPAAASEPVVEADPVAAPEPIVEAEPVTAPDPVAAASPEPEPAAAYAAPALEVAPTVMPEALPEPSAPARARRRREQRARPARPGWLLPVALGLIVVIAAVIGFVVAGSGGSKAPAVETPSAAAANGGLELRFPPSWKRLGAAPRIPGMRFEQPVALAPQGRSGGTSVVFGQVPRADAGNFTLLPPAFLTAAGFGQSKVPPRKAVELTRSGIQAYEYENLQAPGKLTMFAAPTSAGVATIACSAPAADCEAIANTLKLRQGNALPIGPSKAFADAVQKALATVGTASRAGRARLKAATTNRAQAPAARAVSVAYDQAARSLEALSVGPGDAASQKALVARLRAGRQAWTRLSTAAAQHDARGYTAAKAAIATAEQNLQGAVRGLGAAGYSVG